MEKLHAVAMKLIDQIENGDIDDDETIKTYVEMITILFAAIEDEQKENIKERYISEDEILKIINDVKEILDYSKKAIQWEKNDGFER